MVVAGSRDIFLCALLGVMKLTRAMDVDAVVEDVPDTKRSDSASVNLIRLNHMLDAHRTGPLRAFYLDRVSL